MSKIPLPAYSEQTGRSYDSWEKLMAAESFGYTVVVHMRSGEQMYSRVIGIYQARDAARLAQGRIRYRFQRDLENYDDVELVGTNIEPIWLEHPLD